MEQTRTDGNGLATQPSRVGRSQARWGEPEPEQREPMAYQLRLAVEYAQGAPGSETPEARAALDTKRSKRQQFWIDTCREVTEMRAASAPVIALHRQVGWQFLAPSPAQVQQVLDALDSAMPFWDRDHLGLFHQTLQLNFPELLRHWRNHPRR